MTAATVDSGLPTDDRYARNLIGGEWRFPAVPYDVEVRSPLDSRVLTTIPLSSRLDVARAVVAASAAAPRWSASERAALTGRLVAELGARAELLARLQADETGLSYMDSRRAVDGTLRRAEALVARADRPAGPGVDGIVLSWGLPFTEVCLGVLPSLRAGRTVVLKPSLRAPLSAVAFADVATRTGFPAGVVNLVQGTGADVGAALLGSAALTALRVRAGDRTLAQAARAVSVTGVTLESVRGGGNVAIAGPAADPAVVAESIVDSLRVHSGPLGLPALLAHETVVDAVLEAVLDRLPGCVPVPLPTEPLRVRALERVAALRAAGARVLRGGAVPDDAAHRMGWRLPPTVVRIGAETDAGEPTGPVLTVASWRSAGELAGAFPHPRHRDGVACLWGLSRREMPVLPHATILVDTGPVAAWW